MRLKTYAGTLAVLLAVAVPATGQQPGMPRQPQQRAQGQMGPRALPVELALRMKEQLKLTDSQAQQLEAIRREIVTERQAQAQTMIDVQSRLAAGLAKPEDVRKQMQDRREAMRGTVEQRHERISKILTQEQQDQLQKATRRAALRQMHMRGRGRGPGFGPGRGPAFGPGRGFGGRRPGFGWQ